jgi:outer membrane immunogenic protein
VHGSRGGSWSAAIAAALWLAGCFGAVADGPLTRTQALERPFSWTGSYGGVSIGWAHEDFDWLFANASPLIPSASMGAGQGIIGIHSGSQYQFGPWVVGLESSNNGLVWGGKWATAHNCVPSVGTVSDCQAHVLRSYTIGPRIGWAHDHWLVYATGGYAAGDVKTRLQRVAPTNFAFDISSTETHSGYFVGGGVDYALTRHWILGLEYQHLGLETDLHTSSADQFGAAGVHARQIGADTDVVRARLSYKLDGFLWELLLK